VRRGHALAERRTCAWTDLGELARGCGIPFGTWDEIVLASAQVMPNHPGKESVLKTEPSDWDEIQRPRGALHLSR
jgi:hypothetical protein